MTEYETDQFKTNLFNCNHNFNQNDLVLEITVHRLSFKDKFFLVKIIVY